jgi:hypothetical protein
LLCQNCEPLVANTDFINDLIPLSKKLRKGDAEEALTALAAATGHLRANVNARLALEALMLGIPRC